MRIAFDKGSILPPAGQPRPEWTRNFPDGGYQEVMQEQETPKHSERKDKDERDSGERSVGDVAQTREQNGL